MPYVISIVVPAAALNSAMSFDAVAVLKAESHNANAPFRSLSVFMSVFLLTITTYLPFHISSNLSTSLVALRVSIFGSGVLVGKGVKVSVLIGNGDGGNVLVGKGVKVNVLVGVGGSA